MPEADQVLMPRASLAAPRKNAVSVDPAQLERAGLLLPTTTARSLREEQFRHLKRQLLSHRRRSGAPAHGPLLIGVTSALPGEGKTSIAINLALSLSREIDTSVLLVDADVLRPDVLNRLGLPPAPGLLDLLVSPGMRLGDVVLTTDIPKLSILPAGRRADNAGELIASNAMESLLSSLRSICHDCAVVFDAPPLLLSSEARALASMMDQVVIVVEAGKTPRDAVQQAFDAVADSPNVFALLNKGSETPSYGYGDYYG